MKKVISLILVLVLCLSLSACGGENNSETVSQTENTVQTENSTQATEPAPIVETVTAESLAGTYKASLWFLDHAITLNANTSYDFGTTEKGTFKLNGNCIDFYNKEGFVNRQYVAGENCIYQVETAWVFEKDEEYGLAFSPDESGMADQTFVARMIDTNMPGCDYSQIVLDLNTDGSFILSLGHRSSTTADITESFEGTYTSNNSAITLTYNGQDYLLILNDSNHIHFMVYNKT
jgi:uncharacterized lipoprotein YehR (DUF1307 family)